MATSNRLLGIIEIILSGIAFGFLGVFGKAAFEKGILPGELLSLRFFFASFILFWVLLFRKKLKVLSKGETFKSLVLGAFGYALFSSCYFQALKGLSASLTVLLLYLYPTMVSLGALFLFKEKISFLGWIALPLSCAGMALLVWGDFKIFDSSSLFFGIASAFFYSAYILASRKWLQNTPALPSVFFIQLGAALILGVTNFQNLERPTEIIHIAWPLFIGISLISTILAMLLFLQGLKKLSSTEVSILSTSEPLTAIIAASLILNESLSGIQLCGATLVIVSMLMTTMGKRLSKNSVEKSGEFKV